MCVHGCQPIPTTFRVCVLLGCLRMCDNASWQNFENIRYPGNLDMTTRTASNLCARSWSRDDHIFDLDLISPILSENKNLDLYVCRTLILARLRFCVCALFYYTYTLSHSNVRTRVSITCTRLQCSQVPNCAASPLVTSPKSASRGRRQEA